MRLIALLCLTSVVTMISCDLVAPRIIFVYLESNLAQIDSPRPRSAEESTRLPSPLHIPKFVGEMILG